MNNCLSESRDVPCAGAQGGDCACDGVLRASMTKRNAFRRGRFTMVELLVVVAIIAILAGLLFPALQNAKEAAKSIQCINNERQIFLGFNAYQDDWSNYFPPYNMMTYSWSYAMAYGPLLEAFWQKNSLKLISHRLLFCPAEKTQPTAGDSGNYGYPSIPLGGRQFNTIPLKRAIDCIVPSEQYLIMDSYTFTVFPMYTINTIDGIPKARHKGSLNILFADGHAQSQRMKNPVDPWGTHLSTYPEAEAMGGYLGRFDWNWSPIPTKNGWFKFRYKK